MVRFISNDTEGTGRKTRPVSEAIIQTYDNLPVIFGRLPTELVPTRFKVSLQPVLPSILSFSDSNIRRCSLDLGAAILFTGRRDSNNVCYVAQHNVDTTLWHGGVCDVIVAGELWPASSLKKFCLGGHLILSKLKCLGFPYRLAIKQSTAFFKHVWSIPFRYYTHFNKCCSFPNFPLNLFRKPIFMTSLW